MRKPKPSDIVGKIVDLLTPLSPEERSRVIAASRTLLGDASLVEDTETKINPDDSPGGEQLRGVSARAKTWIKQSGITAEQLAQVFHTANGNTDVIAGEMPGKNRKDKTLNAYVLTGIAGLITDGEGNFSDTEARALCTSAGCYDNANHAATLKSKGNWFTGSKERGWTLTSPGLAHAANLIKGLTGDKR